VYFIHKETVRNFIRLQYFICRSLQWPSGLKRRSSAARLLRLWVRIARGTWMFVCRECCVLSSRGLCDGLITHPEKSYRLWRSIIRRNNCIYTILGTCYSTLHTRQSAIQNNKCRVSYKYSCSSWWWTLGGPKHVEVINKIDDIHWEYCAPSWFHLQDYIEMHGQQNIKYIKSRYFPSSVWLNATHKLVPATPWGHMCVCVCVCVCVNGVVAVLILNFDTRLRWVMSFTKRSTYTGNEKTQGIQWMWGWV
jgi:hypothetical protein